MKKVLVVVLSAVLASASGAWAQGTVTDGAAQWELDASNFDTSPAADFRGVDGADPIFEAGWWYRIAGDVAEAVFPTPDSQAYVGDTATLDWTDVDARGLFSAQEIDVVTDGGMPSGTVTRDLTITNISGASLTINIFHFIDADVNSSAGGDTAILTNANDYITMTDTATMEFRGIGADNYQVEAFSGTTDVAAILSDGDVDNLANTGLPFGPGDITAGFQWQDVVIGIGANMTFRSVIAANEMAVPVELLGFSIE